MTRKILLAAALTAAVAGAAPALASGSTKPQIHDAKGDWVVSSQDILDGTVTATATKIQTDLHLAAPPATGVRTEYSVVLTVGCTSWVLDYVWNGGLPGSAASLQQYACSTGDPATDTVGSEQPAATFAAAATATPAGIRITASPTKGLRPGATVTAAALTRTGPLIVIVGAGSTSPTVGGDIATASKRFVLGS